MAAVTESVKELDDTIIFVRVEFQLFPGNSEQVQALPPSDPQNPTLGERLFYRVLFLVERSTGETAAKPSMWRHVDDSLTQFSAGDTAALKVLLKKLYDEGRGDVENLP